MVKIFNQHADVMIKVLERDVAAAPSKSVDLQSYFRRFTMDSFVHSFFGTELSTLEQPSPFSVHFDYLQSALTWRFRLDPLWKVLPQPRQFNEAVKYVNTFMDDLIARARRDPALAERTDLLAQYVRSTDDDGQAFSDSFLRDTFINFLLAGRDTTASLLTWLIYCLRNQPTVEAKILNEIRTVVGMDADPTAEQIAALKYLHKVGRRVAWVAAACCGDCGVARSP